MLKFAREKCVYCKLCEEVCSFRFTEQVRPAVAAIRLGREGKWGLPFARVCNLCEGLDGKRCVSDCPTDALRLTSQGVIAWDREKCNRCMVCIDVCPKQAVAYDEKKDLIVICDLCNGNPLCIQWCPEDVLSQ